MRLSKWGNSLAVRIPASTIEELGLKEGDDVDVLVFAKSEAVKAVERMTDEEAFAALRRFEGMRPADYKFNREGQ